MISLQILIILERWLGNWAADVESTQHLNKLPLFLSTDTAHHYFNSQEITMACILVTDKGQSHRQ